MSKRNLLDLYRVKLEEKQVGDDAIRTAYYPYQTSIAEQFHAEGEDRPLYICWCRRAGKDIFAFTEACKIAIEKPNSRIMYLFPTGKQGKQAILDGITFDNQPIISSVVNPKLLKRPRSGALYHYDNTIKFLNGSVIQVVGDDTDSLVGEMFVPTLILSKRGNLEPLSGDIGMTIPC